jgi:hypothetical protein
VFPRLLFFFAETHLWLLVDVVIHKGLILKGILIDVRQRAGDDSISTGRRFISEEQLSGNADGSRHGKLISPSDLRDTLSINRDFRGLSGGSLDIVCMLTGEERLPLCLINRTSS